MSGAEYHGLTENFHKDNKGCTDWAYDEVYSETFGKKADQEYREDVERYGKTCGLCLYVQLATGWEMDIEELVQTGERIFTMMRLLNLKLGYDTKKETLPEIISRPLEGATEGHVPDIEAQLKTWYEYRGWDRKTGRPPEDKLKKLGLADLT